MSHSADDGTVEAYYHYNLCLLQRLTVAVDLLLQHEADKGQRDEELDGKMEAVTDLLGRACQPKSPVPAPDPENGNEVRRIRQKPEYRTRQERFSNLPAFMRSDLTFDKILKAYREPARAESPWTPSEMDHVTEYIATLTSFVAAGFGHDSLEDLIVQFIHTENVGCDRQGLEDYEREHLEMRMMAAAEHAGFKGFED